MAKKGKYINVNVVVNLSKAIIKYRLTHGMSRETLALEIGVTPRQLANIENCNAKCKIDTLSKILKIIDFDLEDILRTSE